MSLCYVLWNWIAEMMVPLRWRLSAAPSRAWTFCGSTKHRKCSQAPLSHQAAHFCSDMSTHNAMSLIHVLWDWIAEMMMPLKWRNSEAPARAWSFCCSRKHRKCSQALFSHQAAHFHSEMSTHNAMSFIHVLWNWIAEMMAPLRWLIS
jgi:hypothetical protein